MCLVLEIKEDTILPLRNSQAVKETIVVELLSCVQLFCDPTDCSLHQAPLSMEFPRLGMEWVAIFFSRGSSRPRD